MDELAEKSEYCIYSFPPLKTLALWRQRKMKKQRLGVNLFLSFEASDEIWRCNSVVAHGTILMAGPETLWTGHGKFSFSLSKEQLSNYIFLFSPDAYILNNPHFSKQGKNPGLETLN